MGQNEISTSLRSEVMGIGTLMPHLLGVPVWDGGASAPKGADALCSGGLPTRPGLGAPKARGAPKAWGPPKGLQGVSVRRSGSLEVTSAIGDSIPVG